MEPNNRRFIFIFLIILSHLSIWTDRGFSKAIDDVLEMDLKQLMQMDVVVTSVSKRPQKLHEAASAIYVVTQEDIRRSGATNIPEALRMVPGLLVARVDQNHYAISSRGFSRQTVSNKLLVLMDGRTIYSPDNSGVRWLVQDTLLEDIERIEVIRGPGAALWGSNAVNGVINIITKTARATQGTLLTGGTGTEEKGFGALRYGGKIGEKFHYRAYGKYRDRDDGKRGDGTDSFDEKQAFQGGFRSDWQVNPKDHLTMQGDYYENQVEKDLRSQFVSFTAPITIPLKLTETNTGANFIARWNRILENESAFKVQAYYDRATKKDGIIPVVINQADLDFQYDFRVGERQAVSWGLSYHFSNFDIPLGIQLFRVPPDNQLFGFFVHDEITLIPKTWSVILGSKFEYNEFSGLEIQPNIRTAWTPHPKHTLWAAVSRSSRIPGATEDGLKFNVSGANIAGFPFVVRITGDGRTEAEKLLAYEAGYRAQIQENFSFDIAGYVFQYDNLIDFITGAPFTETVPGPTHTVSPLIYENALEGEVFGVEVSADWRPLDFWRLAGSYSYNTIDLRLTTNSVISSAENPEGEPNHMFNIRSYLELPHDLEFDTLLYYVSKYTEREVDSYARLDLRLGWKPTPQFELSLTGQNLLEDQHPEFDDQIQLRSEVERSFIAKATFRFK
jgi:iron complex outermembrane recepter protein